MPRHNPTPLPGAVARHQGLRRFCRSWLLCTTMLLSAREPDHTIPLWSGTPPGVTGAQGAEHRVTGRPRPFHQLTDIAIPELEVFLPPADQRNGTAILVCPGGGFQRLAWEHEGIEVAEWLTTQGISAALLKYRVPAPARTGSTDAQRAMGLVRQHATEWGIDPAAVGILGFSAGGEIAAWLLTQPEGRLYPGTDAADALPARPDFAALVYPGGLTGPRATGIREPIASGIRPGLPPVFLVHAFDDASMNSLEFARALKQAGSAVELHLYSSGGHGFGVRDTGIPTGTWKHRLTDWLSAHGHLDPAPMRAWASRVATESDPAVPPARLTGFLPGAGLQDAYRAQARLARIRASRDPIDAFKGAAASKTAQQSLGIDAPLVAPLFRSGRIAASPEPVLETGPAHPVVVETEIAYIIGTDLAIEVLTDEQAQSLVQAVVPVIELPISRPASGPADAREMVAQLIGSDRFIVGKPVDPAAVAPDTLPIRLHRDGVLLHETTGGSAAGGQWGNLRQVLNGLIRAGYTLPSGSVVLGGALGRIHPGTPGRYTADFGPLGSIAFRLQSTQP